MVDLYHSRRINYKKCSYYKRDERISVGDMGKWVAESRPTGYFYARKTSTQLKQNDVIASVYEVNRTTCMIETNDDIADIKVNDLVLYKKTIWVVDSIQQLEHLKETQFSDGEHYTTILGLRK